MISTGKVNNRLDWIDAAKGLSIILVVMMYAAYSVGEDTGNITVLHWIIGFATPFRMPEFFLISGLFLNRVIDRNWRDFADRRVVHYFYFYGLWALIHILFKTAVASGDPATALSLALQALVSPYGVLWFIYVLALVSVAAKILHSLKVPHWAGFLIGAALQITQVQTGFYAIDQFAAYFVYFYTGYAFAPLVFKLVAKAIQSPRISIALLAVWAIINLGLVFSPGYQITTNHMIMGYAALPVLQLSLAITGALALCVSAALLSQAKSMHWLTWMGSKSLVIYLSFALPMSVVRIVLIKLNLIPNASVLSLVVFAAALLIPLVLYTLIQKTGWGKFLIERPSWAHLPTPSADKTTTRQAFNVPAE